MLSKIDIKPQPNERYSADHKYQDKFVIRLSNKLTTIYKNTPARLLEHKRIAIKNINEQLQLSQAESQNKSPVSADFKRKNFIVSKKKKGKVLSTCPQKMITLSEVRNHWIQEIQYESYQGLREYNEDRMLIRENIMINQTAIDLFAVFDGHGGSSVAEYLRLNLSKTFTEHAKNLSIKQALQKSLQQLESKILQCGIKLGSGSCATILILKQNQYYTANIGDSRILIVKDRQEHCQITQDHKPENPKEKNRIQKLGGKIYRNMLIDQNGDKAYGPFRVHPSKLSVSRTIGDYLIKKNQTERLISSEAEYTSGKIQYGDVILLMSDGAYEKFSNDQISILFSNSERQSLKNRLNNYIFTAKKRCTSDNVSMIAIQIREMKDRKNRSMETSTDESQYSNEKLDNIQVQL